MPVAGAQRSEGHTPRVLVIGDAHGHVVRVRMAGAPPAAVRAGATVPVSWDPGDAHLIVRS